jgi:hypothetical protein
MTLHKIKRSKSPQKRKIKSKKSPSLEEIKEELEKLLRLRESTLDVVGFELSGVTIGKASRPQIDA